MDAFFRDVRIAGRSLARTPGFLVAAVITLALGMGATTAIFSLTNAILLKPVPGREPGRLVNVHRTAPDGTSFHSFSYPDLVDLRAASGRVFESIAAFTGRFVSLRRAEGTELVEAQVVSGNYFETLGVAPLFGRTFGPEEDRPGASAVILSEQLWRRSFESDPAVVGRTATLNGKPYTIVGVMPASFTGTFVGFRFNVWMPIPAMAESEGPAALTSHEHDWLELFGRLAPGVTRAQAASALAGATSALSKEHPKSGKAWGADLRPMTPVDDSLRKVVIRLFALLLWVSGLVLLIACVNVAGLLLARGAARRRELAIRQAIGASRGALVRQLLAETFVLFGTGGVLGVLLAFQLTRLLAGFAPKFSVPLQLDVAPDPFVVLVAAACTAATGVVFGLLPALRASRVDIVDALKDGAGARPLLSRGRSVFVAAQIAAAMLLLVASALLVRSVENIRRTDPGFDARGVRMTRLDLGLLREGEARGQGFYRDVLSRAAAIPGVESAALASSVPLGGFGGGTSHVAVEGFVPPAPEGFEAERAVVSPRYFETLRITLIEGRDFLPSDDASAARVAVVNETLAARFWPGRSALSHRLRVDGTDVEIVGVVKAGKYRSLAEEPRLAVTLPIAQAFRPRMTVLLRTAPGASVTKELREIVRGLDPDLPVLDTMLVSDFIAVSFLPQRMAGAVTTALGLLGVALASVGLYGVVSYAVGRRTKEIGIRMALGARPADVLTLVLRQTAVLAGVGILAGGLLGIGASRLLTGLLFGVAPGDPFAVAAAALLLVIVTLAASAAPARRALGVNPLRALRTE